MKKSSLHFQLPVTILREKKSFVAYSPVIELSTSGKTFEQAERRFVEAAMLFFEEINKKGTLEDVLSELGWQKIKKGWSPPYVVSQQQETIRVPLNA